MNHRTAPHLLLVVSLLASVVWAAQIDPAASHIGFTLNTRWGQSLQGRFPQYQGEVDETGDGNHQVRLRLSARNVEILDHPTYTRFMRGSGFFDAARYPQVEFVSDSYPPALLHDGGPLTGTLSIRGISRHEVFQISPAGCAQPARECDVVATGSIDRGDYGMDRWSFALSDQVRFTLRMRVRAKGGT